MIQKTIIVGLIILNVTMLWQIANLSKDNLRMIEGGNRKTNAMLALSAAEKSELPNLTTFIEKIDLLEDRLSTLEDRAFSVDREDSGFNTSRMATKEPINLEELTHHPVAFISEEWFWQGETTASGIELSFSPNEQFNVHSLECRSGWCRVEIESFRDDLQGLEADLELHAEINESLGRETTIRFGNQDAAKRIVFIK